jgi:hypothetical protein
MLYPLSYEGLRPISYLPGRSLSCAGGSWGTNRCPRVRQRPTRRWFQDAPSKSRACLIAVPSRSFSCRRVPVTGGAATEAKRLTSRHLVSR